MEHVDLNHLVLRAGKMDRLDCVDVTLVNPGDRISYDLSGVFRLSPMRRNVILDPVIDIVTCYVPMRHIYSNWTDFIEAGPLGS